MLLMKFKQLLKRDICCKLLTNQNGKRVREGCSLPPPLPPPYPHVKKGKEGRKWGFKGAQ